MCESPGVRKRRVPLANFLAPLRGALEFGLLWIEEHRELRVVLTILFLTDVLISGCIANKASGRDVVPSSRGGVAAPVRKCREATKAGADGVVAPDDILRNAFLKDCIESDHPVRSIT